MYQKPVPTNQQSLFFTLEEQINTILRLIFGWICGINGHDEESGGDIALRVEYFTSCPSHQSANADFEKGLFEARLISLPIINFSTSLSPTTSTRN
ncbi:MAG: hypothetical protein CW341_06665 [Bacteroidetes bacterium]|nr:hypothetical protein [Bacteroidota bacterium]